MVWFGVLESMHAALLSSGSLPLFSSAITLNKLEASCKASISLSSSHFSFVHTLLLWEKSSWRAWALGKEMNQVLICVLLWISYCITETIMLHCFVRMWWGKFYYVCSTELGCNGSFHVLWVCCNEGCCFCLCFHDGIHGRATSFIIFFNPELHFSSDLTAPWGSSACFCSCIPDLHQASPFCSCKATWGYRFSSSFSETQSILLAA